MNKKYKLTEQTVFSDWQIDGYHAISPDKKYNLWVASGFSFFRDDHAHSPRETLLAGLGMWERYKIWREFCKERRNRAHKFLSKIG